jgi:hypothetical protein
MFSCGIGLEIHSTWDHKRMAEDMSQNAEDDHYEKVMLDVTEGVQFCRFIRPDRLHCYLPSKTAIL